MRCSDPPGWSVEGASWRPSGHPHGGSYARDNWGFDGEAQFLASRGYAVLKPNYRASPGYEWMFADDDHWDFVKMSQDITDASKAMIASGLVDPQPPSAN